MPSLLHLKTTEDRSGPSPPPPPRPPQALRAPARAAKYAAFFPISAADGEPANPAAAFRALRDFVGTLRRALEASAAAAAAAGGGGEGTAQIQSMPEFMLPHLVFLLAHHPDYPPAEELAAEGGAHPNLPFFQRMLQFGLEPLLLPGCAGGSAGGGGAGGGGGARGRADPAEVSRLVPATIKLLRTLKFCDDAGEGKEGEGCEERQGLLLRAAAEGRRSVGGCC